MPDTPTPGTDPGSPPTEHGDGDRATGGGGSSWEWTDWLEGAVIVCMIGAILWQWLG